MYTYCVETVFEAASSENDVDRHVITRKLLFQHTKGADKSLAL
jgi:hypothetical protein